MPRVRDVNVDISNVIIIHPGSWIIRIGLATSTVPCTELNVIARKRKLNGHRYVDDFIPQVTEWTVQQKSDFFMTVDKVLIMLEKTLKSDNTPRHISSPDAIRDFNGSKAAIESNFKGKIIRTDRYVDENDIKMHSEPFNAKKATDEFYVGRKVLSLKANSNYNVHFPYKRGDFNLHSNVGGSMTSVIADLETIIVQTIVTKLRIKKEHFSKYRVIFLIPDIFRRNHVKSIAEMLLVRLDFQCCFFIQEHVCAAFGSGVTTGCVLDMGDQKTSISCVEDGASISETRLRMNYGGADISQILLILLKIREFPYRNFSDCDRNDCCIIRKLAIDSCHLDMDICRPLERSFFVMKSGETAVKYKIQIGDESIVAPLAAMYPKLLKLTGPKFMIGQNQLGFESEDPKDELFLKEITKSKSKETSNVDTNTDKAADKLGELNSDHHLLESGEMYSLTQAILYSIDKCPNDDLKKKMLNNIVIVGGHSKTMNLRKWLLKRLRIETNNIVKPADVEILTPPKDFDANWISWKGAAILAGFETTKELWINKREWVKSGAKVLREKSIFPW